MGKAGRPPKEIKQSQFESLCGIQCTKEEICAVLGVSDKTLDKWVNSTYGEDFSVVFKEKRQVGKASLRRSQFELAKKNATMGIWLGKQYLGQKDSVDEVVVGITSVEDGLSKSLRELGEELESDTVT